MTDQRDPRVANVVRRLVEQAPLPPAFPDGPIPRSRPSARPILRGALAGTVVAAILALVVVLLALGRASRPSRDTTAAGPGTSAPVPLRLVRPSALAVGSDRTLYVSDSGAHQVVAVTRHGAVRVVARIDRPLGLALDRAGNLYVADPDTNTVRRIAPNGRISTFAGDGTAGFAGDGGLATKAQLSGPWALAFGPDGALYISDSGNERVRRVAPDGTITTIAGNGTPGDTGDGGPALDAGLDPEALAFDGSGNLDVFQFDVKAVRRIAPDGVISSLHAPLYASAFATTPAGDVDVADYGRFTISRISRDGAVSTLPFHHTGVFRPTAIAVAPNGDLYVADDGAGGGGPMRILLVHPDGTSVDITPGRQ